MSDRPARARIEQLRDAHRNGQDGSDCSDINDPGSCGTCRTLADVLAILASGEAEPLEAARLRAYRQARIFEPSMEGYHAAMSVYAAAFGEPDGEVAVLLPDGTTRQPWEFGAGDGSGLERGPDTLVQSSSPARSSQSEPFSRGHENGHKIPANPVASGEADAPEQTAVVTAADLQGPVTFTTWTAPGSATAAPGMAPIGVTSTAHTVHCFCQKTTGGQSMCCGCLMIEYPAVVREGAGAEAPTTLAEALTLLRAYRDPELACHDVAEQACRVQVNGHGTIFDHRCGWCKRTDALLETVAKQGEQTCDRS